MTGTLLDTLLWNAAIAAVLGLAVLTLSRRVRRAPLIHALWILVLLKLVTPAFVDVPILSPRSAGGLDTRGDGAELDAFATTAPPGSGEAVDGTGNEPGFAARPDEPAASVAASSSMSRTGSSSVSSRHALLAVGIATWLLGSLAVLGMTVLRTFRLRGLLIGAEATPQRVQAVALELAARIRLRRTPPIVVVAGHVPPLLLSALRGPQVVLPSALVDRLDRDGLESLLAHELAHYARRDHWVRWLELAVAVVYWWHPIVWIARREIYRTEEESCDAWVVHLLPHARKAYGATLLAAVDFLGGARGTRWAASGGAADRRTLERRLSVIYADAPARRVSVAARCALIAFACVLLPVVPAATEAGASPSAPSSPEATPAAEADTDDETARVATEAANEAWHLVRSYSRYEHSQRELHDGGELERVMQEYTVRIEQVATRALESAPAGSSGLPKVIRDFRAKDHLSVLETVQGTPLPFDVGSSRISRSMSPRGSTARPTTRSFARFKPPAARRPSSPSTGAAASRGTSWTRARATSA